MPRISNRVGFLCPVIGCGGWCRVVRTTPAPFAPRDTRTRKCRKCAYVFTTQETVKQAVQQVIPGISE